MPQITFFNFGMFVLLGVLICSFLTAISLTTLIALGSEQQFSFKKPLSVFVFLSLFSLLVSVPVWVCGWLVGFFPFNRVRRFVWDQTESAKVTNATSGLVVAVISSLPVLYLLIEDQRAAEASGVTVVASIAILAACICGPISAIFFFKSDNPELEAYPQ